MRIVRYRKKPFVAELHTRDAILLGVIEGITEYLPVSSTGHLVIATHFLHLDSAAPLHGRNGEPLIVGRRAILFHERSERAGGEVDEVAEQRHGG